MNRREFIKLAQVIGLSPWFGDMAFAQSNDPLRTRKIIGSTSAEADIATLRNGVGILKSNTTETDYKSWKYWANVHGMTITPPAAMQGVWSKCQHGTPHFLSWHRAYLYFFEVLIREITQQNDFSLPYWDWYKSAAIPNQFGEETVNGQGNALYNIRPYSPKTLLKGALGKNLFDEFQTNFEINPHGTVHSMLGGSMADVQTSARDPIFWVHHCNVDRIWTAWLAHDATRKNPSDEAWLNQEFIFDLQNVKKKTAGSVLDTALLGYEYDSLDIPDSNDATPTSPPAPPQIIVVTNANAPRVKAAPGEVKRTRKLNLTGASLNLDFKAPIVEANRLLTMTSPVSKERLTLVFKGIKITDLGHTRGFEYRIYVNLPATSDSAHSHNDFFVGAINSFSLSHHLQHTDTLSFDVGKLAQTLGDQGLWPKENVNISLISDDPQADKPLLTIEDVKLVLLNVATE